MSAFVLNSYHLSILGRAASAIYNGMYCQQLRTGYDVQKAKGLAERFFHANVASVVAHYDNANTSDYSFEFDARALQGVLDPVQVVKAVHCFEYQACEAADYYQSDVADEMRRIERNFIQLVKGFESAQWEMQPPTRD